MTRWPPSASVSSRSGFDFTIFLFSASAMVNYITNTNVKLRERTVYVQFSNRQELKTDSNANSRFKAALLAFSEQAVQNGEPYMDQTIKTTPSNFKTVGPGYGLNTVLHVIVENMVYPVTLDVIFQVFSRVGKVLKIITFNKANKFQVLEMIFSYLENLTSHHYILHPFN